MKIVPIKPSEDRIRTGQRLTNKQLISLNMIMKQLTLYLRHLLSYPYRHAGEGRWIVLTLAVLFSISGGFYTPKMISDIQERNALDNSGIKTTGLVVGHSLVIQDESIFEKLGSKLVELVGGGQTRQDYKSTADVEYIVNGARFHVQIEGDGSQPESLRIGSAVDVVYLPHAPSVASGRAAGAATHRISWQSFLFIWGFILAYDLFMYTLFRSHAKAAKA